MRMRSFSIYVFLSIIVIIVILLSSFIRYYNKKNNVEKTARESFESVKNTLSSAYLAAGSFEAPFFSEEVKQVFKETNNLRVIALYTEKSGIEYLYAIAPRFLVAVPDPKTDWAPGSSYKLRPLMDTLFTSTITLPNGESYKIDGVYTLISHTDLFRIIRDSFLLLILFLLFSLLFNFLFLRSKQAPPDAEDYRKDSKESSNLHGPTPTLRSTAEGFSKISSSPITDSSIADSPLETKTSIAGRNTINKCENKDRPEMKGGLSYIKQRLGFELERAASFDQDLTLVVLECVEDCGTKEIYNNIGSTLAETISFQDLIFEYEKKGFAIIIPNMDLDTAIKDLELFQKKITEKNHKPSNLRFGVSSRNGRLIRSDLLLKESLLALRKAKNEKGPHIVGFRSDPEKYRDFIANHETAKV